MLTEVYKKTIALLSQQDRRKFYLLIPFMMMLGVVEIVGIAFIAPFMAVVADPGTIDHQRHIHWVYTTLQFQDHTHFLIFLGAAVFIGLFVANISIVFINWLIFHYCSHATANLTQRLYDHYLKKPYSYFLNHNSAQLSHHTNHETVRFVAVFVSSMQLIAKTFGILSIIAVLLLVDYKVACSIAAILGISFLLIRKSTESILLNADHEHRSVMEAASRLTSETFGGIKELKLLGRLNTLKDKLRQLSVRMAARLSKVHFIRLFPRYVLELVAFGTVIALVMYLIYTQAARTHVIPLLALNVFAGYRIMPSLQAVFENLTIIRANKTALDLLHHEIVEDVDQDASSLDATDHAVRMNLQSQISLKNVTYHYPTVNTPVLNKISFIIPAKQTIGIVGSTGAGKTTLVDVLMGLLEPQFGEISVDGVSICKKNLASFQKIIGYVPQQIFLTDDTVASNIGLGIPHDKIDHQRVKEVAKIANIHEFVTGLARGYETVLGERGVRISGGQRQRIGIARALYHSPKLLVLDEATSALDGITETAVMDAIHTLSHKITIVLIAHRLATVKACDKIYMLDQGELIASGSYNDLIESNSHFRQMAQHKTAEFA